MATTLRTEEESQDFFDYPLLSEEEPPKGTMRVKLPSRVILPFYTVGITLAAFIASIVLVIVSIRDGLLWLLRQPLRKNTLQYHHSVLDIWKEYFMHFRVYYWTWRFSSEAKASRGYVDIPTDWTIVPFKKVGEAATQVYHRITWDPLDLLMAAWLAVCATPLGLALWAIISMFLTFTPVVVTHMNSDAKLVVSAPVKLPAYQPTETQVQERDFGPWLSYEQAVSLRTSSHVNNMTLLADTGTPRYSAKWTVSEKDPAWTESASFYIRRPIVTGTAATFEDDAQNPTSFHLNVNQPFSFENKIMLIFRIDERGQLWQANKKDVKLIPLSNGWQGAAPNGKLSR